MITHPRSVLAVRIARQWASVVDHGGRHVESIFSTLSYMNWLTRTSGQTNRSENSISDRSCWFPNSSTVPLF